jgi:Ca2+-binding EF-hand superfamily protein
MPACQLTRGRAFVLAAIVGVSVQAAGADLLDGALDPSDPGRQRNAFLAAAGVDSQLSAEEFAADAKVKGGFVRSFDTFTAMLEFDRDANKLISWAEAKACRADQRSKLLKSFDADGDKRLRGEERAAALKALKRGRFAAAPAKPKGPDAPDGQEGLARKARGPLARYDTDGDGMISEAERQAAVNRIRGSGRARRLARFDTDGDGRLSDDERRAWREARQGDDLAKKRLLRYFDTNRDGELSGDEQEALKEMGKQLAGVGKQIRDRAMDVNGDGEITKLETATAAAAWMREGSFLMLKAHAWADADGDGEVSWEEQEEARRQMQVAIFDWFDKFAAAYDKNTDGRYSADERKQMVMGIEEEMTRRVRLADTDEDGALSAREGVAALEAFGREIGVVPAEDQP